MFSHSKEKDSFHVKLIFSIEAELIYTIHELCC